jgi:hypothetical protein
MYIHFYYYVKYSKFQYSFQKCSLNYYHLENQFRNVQIHIKYVIHVFHLTIILFFY